MNKLSPKTRNTLFISALGLEILVVSMLPGCQQQPTPEPTPVPVACTMEALLCPGTEDTSVGRQGPYCLFAACPAPKDKCDIQPTGTGAYMPNPASVYCVDIGGESIIRTAGDGSQYGVCKWNNIEFDEWDLYRTNCGE